MAISCLDGVSRDMASGRGGRAAGRRKEEDGNIMMWRAERGMSGGDTIQPEVRNQGLVRMGTRRPKKLRSSSPSTFGGKR